MNVLKRTRQKAERVRRDNRACSGATLAENASVCPRTLAAEEVRGDLATGIYTVRVSDGSTSKAQKLIVH